jgi:hypothetical protein
MNTNLVLLGLQRIRELGQKAFTAHEAYGKWYPEPLSERDKIELSLTVKHSLEQQEKWVSTIEQELEGDD